MQTRRSWFVLVAAVVLTGAISSTGSVWASHQFSDVSDANTFHDEIAALGEAGITTGYEDGTFRPGANVTRQAMAAFMARGFGRVAHDVTDGYVALTPPPGTFEREVAEVDMTAGATASGGGFVEVDFHVVTRIVGSSIAQCPCAMEAWLIETGGSEPRQSYSVYETLGNLTDETGNSTATMGGSTTFDIPADSARHYELWVRLGDFSVTSVSVHGEITATYVPFDGSPGGGA